MNRNKKTEENKSSILDGLIVTVIILGIIFIPNLVTIMISQVLKKFDLYNIFLKFDLIILILMPLYYIINNLIQKRKMLKIEKNLIKDKIDIEYYREIINEYSPGVLSLVYDGKITYDKDLMLSILYLQNKKWIKIEDDKIVLTGKDSTNLNSNLQKILSNYDVFLKDMYISEKTKAEEIEKIERTKKFHKEWPDAIYSDTIENGLVIERKRKNFFLRYFLSIILFLEFIILLLAEMSPDSNGDGALPCILSLFLSISIMIIQELSFVHNAYPKTQKGYEIYVKLKGLKNYIKDFSELSEKNIQEMEIWEDYLIYALMFNNNTKLNEDSKKLYKKLIEKADEKQNN